MAIEILNINGWDSGWPTGYSSNVDEPIANADGQAVSTPNILDTAIFYLSTPVDITALDTVTGVNIRVRGKYVESDKFTTSTGQLSVSLLIGGVSQGSDLTSDLGTAWSNKLTSHAGWDSAWTLAQLTGAQVRVQSEDGTVGVPFDPTWSIDCIDVEVTYTEVDPITRAPDVIARLLTGKLPIRDVSSEFKTEYPLLGELDLTGKAPTLGSAVVVPEGSLTTRGQISYVNSLTEQLQVNAWDSGWTTGYASNIDEPVSNADGQVVATAFEPDGFPVIESAVLDFDDVSSIVELDEILSVTATVRARARKIKIGSVLDADLGITLLIGGASQGGTTLNLLPTLGSFTNTTISQSGWDQDWSISQLNSLQLRVSAETLATGAAEVTIEIDTIDIVVEYVNQSPFEIAVDPAALLFSGDVPHAHYDVLRTPAVIPRTLTGKAVTLGTTTQALPTAAQLMLDPQLPLTLHNVIRSPAADPLVLGGQVPGRSTNLSYLPAKDSLVLAGKVPVLDVVAAWAAYPARQYLRMESEPPLLPDDTNNTIGPGRLRASLTGQDITPALSNSSVETVADGSINLTTYAPAQPQGQLRPTLAGSLVLTPATPRATPSTVLLVPGGALALLSLTDIKIFSGSLLLGTYVPVALSKGVVQPAQATMTMTGQTVVEETGGLVRVAAEELVYTTHTPTFDLTSTLTGHDHRLISLSVDRRVEFIAAPTDILIE